ncbi:MAG: histidinol-phosphate aminotransferase family protein [Lunatimonas sp.]|uniref:pyridoxal phosphate-dependent aminotransferase n=1 Tax=Lunatimonas sp. TaxID=2060141 RepID=UPI00263B3303|nr:histidinol-phosphate transaminase [Lunatimonas sp.]MCC5938550.1 histidinol-phosphate aminotransferase family protein [Lunatimonas sp.]
MKNLDRRSWLKASMTATAGLFAGGYVNATQESFEIDQLKKKRPSDYYARLSSNENPFGPAASAKKALKAAIEDSFLYPREYRDTLMDTIAEVEGVDKSFILLGAGSSELLHAAARVYGGKNSKVLSADPTYFSLVRSAESMGADWVKVPLTKELDHNLAAMEGKVSNDISLLYLVNPNNPTGKIMTGTEIRSFCDLVSDKVPVFVDEAYIDYMDDPAGSTTVECVRKGKNVIVAKTFSKVHAFAGLRVGYCIAQPEVIKKLAAEGPRNTLSGPSMAAAAASLTDAEFLKYSVKKNEEGKQYIYSELKKLGYDYIPSHTNFILFPISMDGEDFRKRMMANQVSIKTALIENQTYCRVSMGTLDDLGMFASAFKKVSSQKLNRS